MAGDKRATAIFSDVYHLMGSPLLLFHPAMVWRMARSLVTGVGPPSPRPPEVEALTATAAAV